MVFALIIKKQILAIFVEAAAQYQI
jgi:hypothetical protein